MASYLIATEPVKTWAAFRTHLPPSSTYHDLNSTNELCFTSGWGVLVEGGDSPQYCQYVQVPTVTNTDCQNDYQNGGTHFYTSTDNFY